MRPYPWKCGECKAKAVVPATVHHIAQFMHEGTLHDVEVRALPVHRCEHCGAVAMGVEADDAIRRQLRDDLGLLQPEVIRENRKALRLSQEELGRILGHAGESVCRWERGVIQSRATDTALWAFFNVPEVRERLAERQRSKDLQAELATFGPDTVTSIHCVDLWNPGYSQLAVYDTEYTGDLVAANSNYAQAA